MIQLAHRHLILLIVLIWMTGLPSTMPVLLAEDTLKQAAAMPNPPSSPTVVKCALMVLKVIDINDVDESYEAEILILASWKDPRMAFDPAKEGTQVKLFQGNYQVTELFGGWWPQLAILNEVGKDDPNAVTMRVFPDGTVRYHEQRHAVLETPMNLRAFPFDRQKLRISMIPFDNKVEKVVIEVDDQFSRATEEYMKTQKDVNVAGWLLKNLAMKVDTSSLITGVGNSEDRFSRMTTIVTLQRQPWQIIWSILFPLAMIVSVVWSIFWLEIESLNDRLNISFIGILTIVAYQFVIVDDLPSMSYLTFADIVLLISFILMALTVPQSIVVHAYLQRGRHDLAHRGDVISRWAFAILYIGMILLTAHLYGIL